ncbi:SRPBCC family protein [Salinarchaeum sp. IM2453]|uniref:SRPBCC family protein n=1 Tax=Salinarchaeum sp. IM2453 TaxID=2862870 RepID=UPI001C837F15|nr:SRPBCC family protein [Salinarchaeum sp. IM2453]QZA89252.1 SRPBCC family protein [Salinarchaeum sp. IM2453]
MTVRVDRTIEVNASPEDVWEFISDPAKRAQAVSVVSDYELKDEDGTAATWYVEIPIPFVNRTVSVHTEDTERNPPHFVRFVGRSKAMRVEGEHTIEKTENGAQLTNEFVVDGRLPGIEQYFVRNLDTELQNLETELRAALKQ